MLTKPKDAREFPRIEKDILAHVLCNRKFIHVKILNLSCWGAKVRSSVPLPLNEVVGLKFVFISDYFISGQIVEKIDNDYRFKFIFKDLYSQECLCSNVHQYLSKIKKDFSHT